MTNSMPAAASLGNAPRADASRTPLQVARAESRSRSIATLLHVRPGPEATCHRGTTHGLHAANLVLNYLPRLTRSQYTEQTRNSDRIHYLVRPGAAVFNCL